MTEPATLRCQLTAALVDRGEPELAEALRRWTLEVQDRLRARRTRLEPWLRRFGLAVSALGALLSGWAVAVLPPSGCPRAEGDGFFQVATPLFALLGVLFWFLPRVTAALRAWAPGAAARRAPRLLSALRRGLPSEVTYRLQGGRIESSLSRPRRDGATALPAVGGAVVGEVVACLFGRPPFAVLRRLVWLEGPAERAMLLAALAEAGVPVIELGGPAAAPGAPPSRGP